MDTREAIRILDSVCAKFIGTRQDHEIVADALRAIQGLIPATPEGSND